MTKEKIDTAEFDHVMTIALAFEMNKKQDLKIPWEEMKPEIEKLSDTELGILLGLVKNKKLPGSVTT